MRNLLFTLSFDGSCFSGWQIQKNAPTVQEAFQIAFARQFSFCPPLKGCSRTDAGVHANAFCLSLHTPQLLPCDKILYALNCALPSSMAVTDCREVPDAFHARYDCAGKQYIYKILNTPIRNPFMSRYALHYRHALDVAQLHACAQDFVGKHDFSAFQAAGSTVNDAVRTVFAASVQKKGDLVLFSVEGDGFLYHMVRIMVGTLLGMAQGKIEPDAIPSILLSKNRTRAGITAPPQGLYLNRVDYHLAERLSHAAPTASETSR